MGRWGHGTRGAWDCGALGRCDGIIVGIGFGVGGGVGVGVGVGVGGVGVSIGVVVGDGCEPPANKQTQNRFIIVFDVLNPQP